MRYEPRALILSLVLVIGSACLLIFPFSPELNTDIIFDDEVAQRIDSQSKGDNFQSALMLRVSHDDGERLTNDLSRVQELMEIEKRFFDSMHNSNLSISKIQTPIQAWEDAFGSRNSSLEDAEKWADVFENTSEGGWCHENATKEEKNAFETSMILLPRGSNLGIACPSFAGSSATQAPDANEMIWILWLDSEESKSANFRLLDEWAITTSLETNYTFEAVGIEGLFAKAIDIAQNDLSNLIIPSALLVFTLLLIGLKNWKVASITTLSALLVIGAEFGFMSAMGYNFSVIDGVAIPIIFAVAVDGAFWYSRTGREKNEVRNMLLLAMLTTIAAISLALFSQIKAQRSLALVMMVGIILDWLVTRYVLENFYLEQRKCMIEQNPYKSRSTHLIWVWPCLLIGLLLLALSAPMGSQTLDIDQFLPEDDPTISELETLQSKYVLASSAITWVVIDLEEDSIEDAEKFSNFQRQLSQHPSIIALETGLSRSPLVIGITDFPENTTLKQALDENRDSIFSEDIRLYEEGVVTGVYLAVLIDGQNADAAMRFSEDVNQLISYNGLTGYTGGELETGSSLSKSFEETRIIQILLAGVVVSVMAYVILRKIRPSLRIAIGTVALGLAIDGVASHLGGRGVNTAPAVLLGMGFAADYLSHAASGHTPSRNDMQARWGAALSSMAIFILLAFTTFPPAQDTGRLLAISILMAVALATSLAWVSSYSDEEE